MTTDKSVVFVVVDTGNYSRKVVLGVFKDSFSCGWAKWCMSKAISKMRFLSERNCLTRPEKGQNPAQTLSINRLCHRQVLFLGHYHKRNIKQVSSSTQHLN